MPPIAAINNDADLDAALERIGPLMSAVEGTPEFAELIALTQLIVEYEAIHYPIEPPTPAGAIQVRLEDLNLSADDLLPALGSQEQVDAVLSGHCDITPAQAQALHQLLGIDLELLLQQPAAANR